jgi:hypothetical protein
MMKLILYLVSAMEMAGLLWWNTINHIHFTEFYITEHLRTYIELLVEAIDEASIGIRMNWDECNGDINSTITGRIHAV